MRYGSTNGQNNCNHIRKSLLIVTVTIFKDYLIVTVTFSGLGFDSIWCLHYESLGQDFDEDFCEEW